MASVAPANAADAVALGATIDVTFDQAMNANTITATTTTTCTGSVQLSSDDFTTCVAMSGNPSTSDDTTFTLTPAADLDRSTTYKLRVTTDANASGGTPLAAAFTVVPIVIMAIYLTVAKRLGEAGLVD